MSRVFDEDDAHVGDPAQRWAPDGSEGEPPRGSLRPAGPRLVAVLVVLGALLGWLVVSLFDLAEAALPRTPWTMSAMLLMLGATVWWYALRLRGNLADPRTRPSPEVAVAAFVVGRTMLAVGALLAGAHVTYALSQLGRLGVPLYRTRALAAALAVVGSAVFALGGWRLEQACRIEETDEGSPPDPS